MFKKMHKKIDNAILTVYNKAQQVLRNDDGASEMVTVVGLIIGIIVVLVVVFFPAIKTWFNNTVMQNLTDKTGDLFDFS